MKNITNLVMGVVVVAMMSVVVTKMAMAQDAVKVAPESYKVLLENERVRVLEFRNKPGNKSAMHTHPAYIVYTLTAGKIKVTLPDGKTIDRESSGNEVFFNEGETHTVEAMGSTESHGLLIELK